MLASTSSQPSATWAFHQLIGSPERALDPSPHRQQGPAANSPLTPQRGLALIGASIAGGRGLGSLFRVARAHLVSSRPAQRRGANPDHRRPTWRKQSPPKFLANAELVIQ